MNHSPAKIAFAFCLLFYLFAPRVRADTSSTTQPSVLKVQELIASLGSDSAQQRDAAQQELVNLGPSVEPALAKAAQENEDPEIRSRAAAAIAQITDQGENQPSLITLHAKSGAAQAVLDLIGEQAHTRMTVSGMAVSTPDRPGHTVTLDVDRQPFWEVMSNVCGQLSICPDLDFNKNNAMRFRPAWENWMAKSPHEIVGPYWVSMESLTHVRTSALAGDPVIHDQFTAKMIVYPEPRLVVTRFSDFKVEEATDNAGNSLMPRPLPTNIHPPLRPAGALNHSIEFGLTYPQEKAGSKISILRGSLVAIVAQEFQQYQMDDVLGTPIINNPLQGADLQLHVAPQGSGYYVDVKCIRAKLAQDQWTALLNCMGEMTLEDANGHALTPVRPLVIHSMSDGPGPQFFSADAVFSANAIAINASQPTTRNIAEPMRLRWNFPKSFKAIKIAVTFKDLQMP